MKRVSAGMCMVVMFTVGTGISAQSGAADRSQTDKRMMKDGEMTVSGCVSAGKESGQYMLTNAMMMGGMMDKETMGKDTMGKDKMKEPTGGHMMSYELVGDDLKAHVGHRVEVTGTMSRMDMDRMKKMQQMDKMDKDKMQQMSDKDMKPMKLNVKSLKMVSSSCS